MDNYEIGTATATIHFSKVYRFQHYGYYAFDIRFHKTSTIRFDHLSFIKAGESWYKAEEYVNAVKQNFASAGIHEESEVSLLFSGSQILAISARGNDSWIDVREGVFPHVSAKPFAKLGIVVTSLEVH